MGNIEEVSRFLISYGRVDKKFEIVESILRGEIESIFPTIESDRAEYIADAASNILEKMQSYLENISIDNPVEQSLLLILTSASIIKAIRKLLAMTAEEICKNEHGVNIKLSSSRNELQKFS